MSIRAPAGKSPYAGTKVPVERSKSAITELLRAYGAEGVQWTDNFGTGEVELRFAVRQQDQKVVMYRVTPAAFRERHSTWDPVKGKRVVTEAPDWSRSLRLLLAWVKTKVESVAFGLTTVEEEFLAQRLVYDSQGRERTVGEVAIPAINSSGGRLALEAPRAAPIEPEVIDP